MTPVRQGLSESEAADRLRKLGPNEVPQPPGRTVWDSVGHQLRDPLIVVLQVAALLTVAVGDWPDAIVIALVVVANTSVGVVQERRADQAVAALAQLSTPLVRVVREGREHTVPANQLVPGDIVVLAEGDIVPADARVLEAVSLLVDESMLTGESVSVGKSPASSDDPEARPAFAGPDAADAATGAEQLHAGTVLVKGRGVAEITATGSRSALGRIATMLSEQSPTTPLQTRLAELGRWLAAVAVVLCGIVGLLGLLRGESVETMLVTAISLAVAAVPESLPAVVTFGLALGARRMAERNAIIRHLPAVETLGSVTVLATDKTGTLTEARMLVEEIWTPGRQFAVPPDGGDELTSFVTEGASVEPSTFPELLRLLEAVTLCNDATWHPPGPSPGVDGDSLPQIWERRVGTGTGDPTEVALLAVAAKAGIERTNLEASWPRVDEVPFDSIRQSMTTRHVSSSDDRTLVVTKGSPEAVQLQLGHRDLAGGRALRAAAELSARGFRVLAVAAGEAPAGTPTHEVRQHLLGLVAMNDPAKPTAQATLAACRRAGITPVLITGDHAATAQAIARRVGVLDDDRPVMSGEELRHAGPDADVSEVRVFARTTPDQKLQIVRAWRESGAVVAMTGDGVNDGPALRAADIGVAMGHRGTEVARQAADLVLADDELSTVVAAVEEGRRVYTNIRLFLLFALAGGAAAVWVMMAGPWVGLTVPLTAAQILWINLLTHGLTGVALGAEPPDPGAMSRPPRRPEQSVLGDGLWQGVVALSLAMAAATLAAAVWARAGDQPTQTVAFLALTSLELGVALGVRPRLFTRANLFLPLAVAGSAVLAVAAVYLPVLNDLLGTEPVTAALLVGLLALALVSAALTRLLIAARRHRERTRSNDQATPSGGRRSPAGS